MPSNINYMFPNTQKITCHDCKEELEVQDKNIKNGVLLTYQDNGEKINVFKCSRCYAKSPSLINFRECEVYSRIVGYLRPIQQWNEGKKQEFIERKEYRAS